MDIERQNFLKEVESEIKNQSNDKNIHTVNKIVNVDELFCEAVKNYGTTLKKLK